MVPPTWGLRRWLGSARPINKLMKNACWALAEADGHRAPVVDFGIVGSQRIFEEILGRAVSP